MRTRKQIEATFKDLVVPSGSDHIRLQIELFLDIRELLFELVSEGRFKRQLEDVRQARLRRELARKDAYRSQEDEDEEV